MGGRAVVVALHGKLPSLGSGSSSLFQSSEAAYLLLDLILALL